MCFLASCLLGFLMPTRNAANVEQDAGDVDSTGAKQAKTTAEPREIAPASSKTGTPGRKNPKQNGTNPHEKQNRFCRGDGFGGKYREGALWVGSVFWFTPFRFHIRSPPKLSIF